MGPETKNDCAGEGQQQFAGLDWLELVESRQLEKWVSCGAVASQSEVAVVNCRACELAIVL
jgi:hypothetical protein